MDAKDCLSKARELREKAATVRTLSARGCMLEMAGQYDWLAAHVPKREGEVLGEARRDPDAAVAAMCLNADPG
jgi:hypothetical protein